MFSRLKDLTVFDLLSWVFIFCFANGVTEEITGYNIQDLATSKGRIVCDRARNFLEI